MNKKILLTAILTFISAPAVAQFDMMAISQANLNSTLIDVRAISNDALLGDDEAVDIDRNLNNDLQTRSQQRDVSTLTFVPSQQIRRANLSKFVSKTRKVDPETASKMQQLFASTDVVGQVDQMMRPMGLRANNVADAYTVWWITAWEAVNQRDMGSNADMVQAVKQQAASALLSTPQFASATNAQKQEMAEALLIQAALIDASEEMFANDSAQLRALSRAVNQGAMAMDRDLDLTKMTLTPNGFVPRSGGRSDAGDVSGDGAQLAATEEGGSNLALYAVAGTGLLAGVFALGKGLAKKG